MKEPCRSCPEREKDFGGCRCQAYLITGDPANTDPACNLSPQHNQILEAIETAGRVAETDDTEALVLRNARNSRVLIKESASGSG